MSSSVTNYVGPENGHFEVPDRCFLSLRLVRANFAEGGTALFLKILKNFHLDPPYVFPILKIFEKNIHFFNLFNKE